MSMRQHARLIISISAALYSVPLWAIAVVPPPPSSAPVITANSVPEPASWALVGLGLVAAAAVALNKRK